MGLNSQKYRRATNLSLGGFGAQTIRSTAGHSEVKLSHDGTRPKKPSFVSKDTETKGQLDNCQTSNFGHLLNYQLDSLVTPVPIVKSAEFSLFSARKSGESISDNGVINTARFARWNQRK